MEIQEKHKKILETLNSTEKLNNDIVGKLLENCCRTLAGKTEAHDISSLCEPGTFEIQQLYASLLYVYAQFVRHSQSKEDFSNFLRTECGLETDHVKTLEDYYGKWNKSIRIQLLNIGSHLPHITDVKWKIDYVVKSKILDQSEGPIFRVSLKTEKYSEEIQRAKTDFIEFTCTSQELQDLAYKLKDAVRHCQRLATEH